MLVALRQANRFNSVVTVLKIKSEDKKMKVKKVLGAIFSVALAGVLSLSTTACGKKDDISSDPKVVNVAVVAKGYGSDFVKDLAESYNETHKDVTVKVVKTTPDSSFVESSLNLGASKNKIDLYFTILNNVFATQSVASSYKWADLSDVYEADLEGYNETGIIKDLMNPYYYQIMTYTDGKQYALPWTSGAVGLLYNKTLWDKTNNSLKAANKAELALPVTTDEMFELFDRIKTADVKSASGKAYAFSYSGIDSYLHFLFGDLWMQYEGKAVSEAFYEGKNESGTYTADIYNTTGRLKAYDTIRSMILQSNGYVSTDNISDSYDQEQLNFLRGEAFFSANGDWLEREASKQFNPGDADVAFIRTPIISSIVENPKISADFTGDKAANETKLRSIINFIDENYIDGNKTASAADAATLGISESTLKFLSDSRMIKFCLPDFVASVPEYSTSKDLAKDFLKYMYSKDGQEIVMSATYGCMAPLTVDISQFDYYADARIFSKSKLEIVSKQISLGNAMNYPMEYLGQITPTRDSMPSAFGTETPSFTAKGFLDREYNYYKSSWSHIMSLAGVKN